jgi:hypothetical protein
MSAEGDVILIYHEEKPAVFARIERIEPDIKRDWYQVTLQLLTLPLQTVTWILRGPYIDGEPFTMGGKGVRLEEIPHLPEETPSAEDEGTKAASKESQSGPAKIIPFHKNLKKDG